MAFGSRSSEEVIPIRRSIFLDVIGVSPALKLHASYALRRMKAKLDVVGDFRIAVLWQAPFNRGVSLESPSLDRMECDDLHDGTKCSPCGLLCIPSVMKDIAGQRLLQSIDGRIGHFGLKLKGAVSGGRSMFGLEHKSVYSTA